MVVLEDSPDYYIQNHMWPRERIIGSSPSIVIANPANYVLLVWIIELKGVHPTQNPCSSDHGGGEQDRRGLIRNFLCLVDLLVASSDDSLLRHGREINYSYEENESDNRNIEIVSISNIQVGHKSFLLIHKIAGHADNYHQVELFSRDLYCLQFYYLCICCQR